MYSNLSDQTKVTLNEINKIKDCFNSEIQERNIMSKKNESMHCCFRLFWQTLIVLSATRGGINFFFYKCYWSSCRNSKCKFWSCIFFDYRSNKEIIRNNKKLKKNIIKLLC